MVHIGGGVGFTIYEMLGFNQFSYEKGPDEKMRACFLGIGFLRARQCPKNFKPLTSLSRIIPKLRLFLFNGRKFFYFLKPVEVYFSTKTVQKIQLFGLAATKLRLCARAIFNYYVLLPLFIIIFVRRVKIPKR